MMKRRLFGAAAAAILIAAPAAAHDGEKCQNANVTDAVDLIKPVIASEPEAEAAQPPLENADTLETEEIVVDGAEVVAENTATAASISVADYEADQTGTVVDAETAAAVMVAATASGEDADARLEDPPEFSAEIESDIEQDLTEAEALTDALDEEMAIFDAAPQSMPEPTDVTMDSDEVFEPAEEVTDHVVDTSAAEMVVDAAIGAPENIAPTMDAEALSETAMGVGQE